MIAFRLNPPSITHDIRSEVLMKFRIYTLFALLVSCAGTTSAQTAFDSLYVTNGTVSAVVVSGNTIYIGGSFTAVGPNTGRGAALAAATGTRDPAFPKVNETIYAVVPDGSGGWYIGGSFTSVGGTTRNQIAHIRSDKTVDPSWNPNADGDVDAFAVSGSTVYAGGSFNSIGGHTRNCLAALNASTGSATSWNPNATFNVYAIALDYSKARVYAGGDFTRVLNDDHTYFVGLTDPGDASLPVEIASFIVVSNRLNAELKWTTATEVNNYGFEIERRQIGNWSKIGFVGGSGTASSPHEYSFTDRSVSPGRYAYRIKQTDRTGKSTYTPEATVEVGMALRVFSLDQNYPNPFNPSTTIRYTIPQKGRVSVKVFDVLGRDVATLVNGEQEAGLHQVVFEASRFATGVYFYHLQAGNFAETRKLLLMK
jgi:hypothetical protein